MIEGGVYMQIKQIRFEMAPVVSIFISIIYFLCLYQFYVKEYEVLDYFLYESFTTPSPVGYSSLFVVISDLLIEYSEFMQLSVLLMVSFSLAIYIYI